jgi:hypothetical protein
LSDPLSSPVEFGSNIDFGFPPSSILGKRDVFALLMQQLTISTNGPVARRSRFGDSKTVHERQFAGQFAGNRSHFSIAESTSRSNHGSRRTIVVIV